MKPLPQRSFQKGDNSEINLYVFAMQGMCMMNVYKINKMQWATIGN